MILVGLQARVQALRRRLAALHSARSAHCSAAERDRDRLYSLVIRLVQHIWRLQGVTVTVIGVENLPPSGGAVVAINHTSFIDFVFAGRPAAVDQGLNRRVRFMAKQEVFKNRVVRAALLSMGHIPVDRSNGRASLNQACAAFEAGGARRNLSGRHH